MARERRCPTASCTVVKLRNQFKSTVYSARTMSVLEAVGGGGRRAGISKGLMAGASSKGGRKRERRTHAQWDKLRICG